MNTNIIKIADKIARNEEITNEEFKLLKGYIYKSNKGKQGNREDVLSNFVLDVRENYNPDMHEKQKEAWIYAHIKYSILIQGKFDATGMLYNPVPVPLVGDTEGGIPPDSNINIEWVYSILHNDIEKDIYTNCILGSTPIVYIANDHGKSAEWGRVVRNRIIKRIKEYIEKKGK